MKTVLVFKASDILAFERVRSILNAKGIETYGPDATVHVIYPNTPNLYLGGISAIQEGYPIFVAEDQATEATAIIGEIETAFLTAHDKHSDDQAKYPFTGRTNWERFYLVSIFGLMIPFLPMVLCLYFFIKALSHRETISTLKLIVAFGLLGMNFFTSYVFLGWILP